MVGHNFVRRHYPSLKTHSFPLALLSENCLLLRTDHVRRQLCEHIFVSNRGYCLHFIHYMPILISLSGNCCPVLCSTSPPSFSPTLP